jgi:hypothetical protein
MRIALARHAGKIDAPKATAANSFEWLADVQRFYLSNCMDIVGHHFRVTL